MIKNYFVMVSPAKGDKLHAALNAEFRHANADTTRRIKRVLNELQGINEMARGFNRQMMLTKAELRLVGKLNSEHELGIEIIDL